MLGQVGFFDHFQVAFDRSQKCFAIIDNGLLSEGSQSMG